jgi:hypothetical protein
LDALLDRYRQTKAGLKEKTRVNVEWTIINLLKHRTLGTDKWIREMMFLRQIFQVALDDGVIAVNPVEMGMNSGPVGFHSHKSRNAQLSLPEARLLDIPHSNYFRCTVAPGIRPFICVCELIECTFIIDKSNRRYLR